MDELINFARRFKGFLRFAALVFLGLIFLFTYLFSRGSFDQLLTSFSQLSSNQFLSVVYITLGLPFIIIVLLILLSFKSTVPRRPQGPKTLIWIDDEEAVIRDARSAQIPGWVIHPFSDITARQNLNGHLNRLRPDGVILDFDVPPGGRTLYEWIREWRQDVPVIIYTRHINHPRKMEQIVAMGVSSADIIPKTADFGGDILEIKRRFQRHWS